MHSQQYSSDFGDKVNIQSVRTNHYLSCGDRGYIQKGSASATFKELSQEREIFEMAVTSDNGAIFRSHNDLFLSVTNDTTLFCGFRTCNSKDGDGLPVKGRWEIIPSTAAMRSVVNDPKMKLQGATKAAFGFVRDVAAEIVKEVVMDELGFGGEDGI